MSLISRLRLQQPWRLVPKRFLSISTTRRSNSAPTASILQSGIELQGAVSNQTRSLLPNIWLRDSCRCDTCVNQDTLQRNFNTFTLPKNLAVLKANPTDSGLQVKWNDGHQSTYSWDFLSFYLSNNARKPEEIKRVYWGAEVGQNPECELDKLEQIDSKEKGAPVVKYEEVMDESGPGVGKLTRAIRTHGFVFIVNTPATPEATEQVLERIAFIRITHYGGFYDFIPDLAMADTAYTNLALAAHTDTTYFTEPAGLQSFHMLEHKAPPGINDCEKMGGESLLVDGFNAALKLHQENPEAFKILSTVRLPWHASGNKGINIAPDQRYPVIELSSEPGEILHRIRWNNDDRGVVPFDCEYGPDQWYEAASKWDAILRRKDMEFWTQLTPGKVLVFDNWRVLHGRAAFTGIRRICGGYTARDDFISRWRNTNYPRESIIKQVVG